jgi:abhydrolase domain-containing protein 6
MKLNSLAASKPLRFSLFSIPLLLGAALALPHIPAHWVLPLLYRSYQWRSGVHEVTVQTRREVIPAFEGGIPTEGHAPLLLLHGFGDSRFSFVQTARWLTPHFQVLLPEFPGFGSNPYIQGERYSIREQAERVHEILQARGWPKAHLIGNSMGGHIAAAFALRYPNQVASLILLSPAGLLVDDPVPYRPQERPIVTEADFDAFMGLLFYQRPWIPHAFKLDFIEKAVKNFEGLQAVRAQIRNGEDYILNERLSQIQAPTHIIWGRHDGVVRVAHAPVWKEKIPQAQLTVFEDAAHSLQYEYPERTGKLIRNQIEAWTARK